MAAPHILLKKKLLENSLGWFVAYLNQRLIVPLQGQFPNYPLPRKIEAILRRSQQIQETVQKRPEELIDLVELVEREWSNDANIGFLFKQILLLNRRDRATSVEGLLAKTFDPEMTAALRLEIDALDAAVTGSRTSKTGGSQS